MSASWTPLDSSSCNNNPQSIFTFEERLETLFDGIQKAMNALEALNNQLQSMKQDVQRIAAWEKHHDGSGGGGGGDQKKKRRQNLISSKSGGNGGGGETEPSFCDGRHSTIDAKTGHFRCTICFADLGFNGRQLCGKTKCMNPSQCLVCLLPRN